MTAIQRPPGMRWKLQLVGHDEELRGLAKMFGPSANPAGLRVWSEDGRHYLHAPEFDAMTDSSSILARGEVLVGRLNGLGFLKFGTFRPIETGNVMQAAPNGADSTFVMVGPAIFYVPSRELLAYLDYTPNRPPAMNATVGPIVAALAPVEGWKIPDRFAAEVDEALALLPAAVRSEDWRLLHFIYEIVEGQVGQPSKVAKVLKCSVVEIQRFSDTANSKSVLGTKARHGRQKRAVPSNPMTFREARKLVQGIVLAWVRHLSELRA